MGVRTAPMVDAPVIPAVDSANDRSCARLHSIAAARHICIPQGLRDRKSDDVARAIHLHTQEIYAQYAKALGAAGGRS